MVLLQGEALEHLLAAGCDCAWRTRTSRSRAAGRRGWPADDQRRCRRDASPVLAVAGRRATSLNLTSTQAAVNPELLDVADQDYRTRLRARQPEVTGRRCVFTPLEQRVDGVERHVWAPDRLATPRWSLAAPAQRAIGRVTQHVAKSVAKSSDAA